MEFLSSEVGTTNLDILELLSYEDKENFKGWRDTVTRMRIVSNYQSGKSIDNSPNGAKEIYKLLIEGLKSQNINRNQSFYTDD